MVSLIVPTRNRPDNVARFYASWVNTGSKGELILVTDHDDPNDYTSMDVRVVTHCYSDGPHSIARAGTTVEKLNAGAAVATYDIIGFSGDDVVIKTDGWESIVSDAMKLKRLSLTYPMCGKGQYVFPTHIFMTRALYETLGWYGFPKLQHPWVDYVWEKIGKYLNETGKGNYQSLPDVLFKHLHPMYCPHVEEDDTYRRAYANRRQSDDKRYYEEYTPTF